MKRSLMAQSIQATTNGYPTHEHIRVVIQYYPKVAKAVYASTWIVSGCLTFIFYDDRNILSFVDLLKQLGGLG